MLSLFLKIKFLFIKKLTVNKSSLENDNIVSVKLEKKFKYNTSETKTKLLHIKRMAATEITSGYASGYVQWAIDFASDNKIIKNTVLHRDNNNVITIRVYIMWNDGEGSVMDNLQDTSATNSTGKALIDVKMNFKQVV